MSCVELHTFHAKVGWLTAVDANFNQTFVTTTSGNLALNLVLNVQLLKNSLHAATRQNVFIIIIIYCVVGKFDRTKHVYYAKNSKSNFIL